MSKPRQETGIETFRDSIATVDKTGHRNWIYPKKPKGRFYNARTWVSIILLILLFGIPFIKINGDPLFLFNILERKFILFGIVFTPQDLHLFALAMVTLMLFVVLFTVIFGRIFCGWICPQTIFMEMVLRKVEYWIEGDYKDQQRLNAAPWTTEKFIKKTAKHLIFFLFAVLIANTFLAWIIGIDQVKEIVLSPIRENLTGFIAMLIFSVLFYFVFSWFREQVCIAVCPYGRLQGVLLVPESIVVHYDFVRGEPRGKKKRAKANPLADIQQKVEGASTKVAVAVATKEQGDCIDCNLCVHVCPTGIDIRNGTQLECVNCTACIDACDEVMDKIDRPRGLIRYDSYKGIKEGRNKIMTTRVWAYSGVLFILMALQLVLFSTRTEVEAVILRTPGKLYQKIDETHVSNLYNYQVINKTKEDIGDISFKLTVPYGKIKVIGDQAPPAPKQGMSEGAMFIEMDKTKLESRKTEIVIEVYSGEELIDKAKTNFFGPGK